MAVAESDAPRELTPRQQRIVDLLADGSAPKQIALTLEISVDTVRSHLKSAKRRTSSRTLAQLVADHGRPDPRMGQLTSGLTDRQRDVVWHLARGKSLDQIGDALGISPRTAEMHVGAAKDRLGVATTSQLVAVAALESLPGSLPQSVPRLEAESSSAVVASAHPVQFWSQHDAASFDSGDSPRFEDASSTTAVVPLPSKQFWSQHETERVDMGDSLPTRIVRWVNALVACAATVALAFHFLAPPRGLPSALTPAVLAALVTLLAAVVMLRHPDATARILATRPGAQLAVLVCVGVLVADPAAQLWWPAAALLMLLVPVAPTRRVFIFCLIAGLVSAGAYLVELGPAHALSVPSVTVWFSLIVPPLAVLVLVTTVIRAGLGTRSATYDVSEAPSELRYAEAAGTTPGQLTRGHPTNRMDTLTPREREMVGQLANGLLPKQIAFQSGASLSTVRSALQSAKRKTGARTLHELAALSTAASMATDEAAPPSENAPSTDRPRLTTRQLQVILLAADGMRYSEIAALLDVSPRAVHRHLSTARAKVGANTTAELVAWAARAHILPPR